MVPILFCVTDTFESLLKNSGLSSKKCSFSVIYLIIQQIFMEHLCAGYYCKDQRNISEKKIDKNSYSHGAYILARRDRQEIIHVINKQTYNLLEIRCYGKRKIQAE